MGSNNTTKDKGWGMVRFIHHETKKSPKTIRKIGRLMEELHELEAEGRKLDKQRRDLKRRPFFRFRPSLKQEHQRLSLKHAGNKIGQRSLFVQIMKL